MTNQRTRLALARLDDRAVPAALDPTAIAGAGIDWTIDDLGGVTAGAATGDPGLRVADAAAASGQTDAFDGGVQLFVNGVPFTAAATSSGPTVTAGPAIVGGLDVSVRYDALPGSPTLRTLVTFANPGPAAAAADVRLASNLGSDAGTVYAATSSGGPLSAADRWVVTDDTAAAGGTLAVVHVLAGPGRAPADVGTTAFDNGGTEGVSAGFAVSVPAGESRSLLFFHQVYADRADAAAAAVRFDATPAAADALLVGLPADQLAGVTNWDFAAPTTADAGGPYAVAEGGSIVLTATAATTAGRTITAFAWDLDGDGTFETAGRTATFAAAGVNGPATRTVRVRATDSLGGSAVAAAAVRVTNAAPSLTDVRFDAAAVEGQPADLVGRVGDAADEVTLTVVWGDGTEETFAQSAGAFRRTHTYATARPEGYAVRVTAADADGAVAESVSVPAAVAGVPPALAGLAVTSPAAGEPATLTGRVADPGTDPIELRVEWGDGTTDFRTLEPGDRTFALTHIYETTGRLDVRVTAADAGGLTDTESIGATIRPAALAVVGLAASPAVDRVVTLNGTAAGGASNTLAIDIDWGDGRADRLTLPAGSPLTATHGYARPGEYQVTVTAADENGATASAAVAAIVPSAATSDGSLAGRRAFAVGTGAGGGPVVTVYDADTGAVVRTLMAGDPADRSGVSAVVGDVTGDGVPDMVAGSGAGPAAVVRVYDGATGELVRAIDAFEAGFRGGARVAVGDVTGDGVADVIVGAGEGGGPRVRVFAGRTFDPAADFFAGDAGTRGGVWVAAVGSPGGPALVAAGAGAGQAPTIATFRLAAGGPERVWAFAAYADDFLGGVRVAGRADTPVLVTAAGPGGGPHVRVFDPAAGTELGGVMAADPASRGGASVALADAADGSELIVGTGGGPLRRFALASLRPTGEVGR